MAHRENFGSRKDLTGLVFGRLMAIRRSESRISPKGKLVSVWFCRCSCGREIEVCMGSLTSGATQSCGCLNKDTGREVGLWSNKKHGGASMFASVDDRVRFQILQHIRRRARSNGYETDLQMDDFPVLGDTCPVLGIKFKKHKGALADESVSIDKVNPNLPYLKKYKDNLRFISYRANRIKNDATLEELRKVVEYVENSTQSHSAGSENLL